MFTKCASIFFTLLVCFIGSAFADSQIQTPIFEPEQIAALTQKYLAENQEKVEWCSSYSLEAVSFWYIRGKWYLRYDCAEKRPGYYFTISVTNEDPPQFDLSPGK